MLLEGLDYVLIGTLQLLIGSTRGSNLFGPRMIVLASVRRGYG